MANSKYFIKYDTAALNKDVPIDQVLERYMGVQVNGRRQIHCPKPEHIDKKPSATVYHRTNTCHCFSCNSTFKPVDIAMMAMPNLEFIEVCERLCSDFGLNPYQYSNKGEIEKLRENVNSSKNNFIEYFPLDKDDLAAIGLSDTIQKMMDEITWLEYDKAVYGEDYVQKTRKKYPDVYVSPDETLNTTTISRGEYISLYRGGNPDEYEMYSRPIRLEWQKAVNENDKEARDNFEQIIKNLAYTAIEKYNEDIETYQNRLNDPLIKKYLSSPDKILEAKKWYMGYMLAQYRHITPKVSPLQKCMIEAYDIYDINKNALRSAKDGLDQAEQTLAKLEKYQEERETAEKSAKKGFNFNR